MRRLLATGLFALAAMLPTATAARARPDWISGCSASASDRYYAARCTSGNARYFSKATCYKPKVGSFTDYGQYVWPGTTSYGSCPLGYLASNPGWTQ